MAVFLTNYRTIYGIDEKNEGLCSFVQQRENDYCINKWTCELAVNSFVVTIEKLFDVEFDAEQNKRLLRDMTKKLITRFL